jgi:hypothetical protein
MFLGSWIEVMRRLWLGSVGGGGGGGGSYRGSPTNSYDGTHSEGVGEWRLLEWGVEVDAGFSVCICSSS